MESCHMVEQWRLTPPGEVGEHDPPIFPSPTLTFPALPSLPLPFPSLPSPSLPPSLPFPSP